MEALSEAFLLFLLLPDWLKLNHLKSRMECGFSDIFSRHICSTVAETIGVKNYSASFGAKNVQKTTFEAAKMILDPWNQQIKYFSMGYSCCMMQFLVLTSGFYLLGGRGGSFPPNVSASPPKVLLKKKITAISNKDLFWRRF